MHLVYIILLPRSPFCKVIWCVCVIHAGPWLTFEIQLPQDDFNLLAWVLGEQISTAELGKSKDDYQLRGLSSEEQLLNGMRKSH